MKKDTCRSLGPVVDREPCPCGAIVELNHCTLHNQTCVTTQYGWEQSFDFRSASREEYRAADHQRLLICCEKCLQKTRAICNMQAT